MLKIPEHIADQHSRMAWCAMRSGELNKALAAIHRAYAMATESSSLTTESGVDAVCNPRTYGLLVANGIHTIGDLIQLTAEQLSDIPQISWRTIDVLQENLSAAGFKLRE